MRVLSFAFILAACGPAQHGARPYPEPSVAAVVGRLTKAHADAKSFRADTTMDYWMNNQRIKGEVLVMGKTGAFVRIAAMSPAGGSTLAEMVCDGSDFVYLSYQNNCTMTGPCDRSSIAQFFGVELAPDDFLHLAVGTPPVPANATGTVAWNGKTGLEDVHLTGEGETESLSIDMRDGRFDVMSAQLVGANGKPAWTVTNGDFVDVGGRRVPGRSRFKAAGANQDLEVNWGDVGNRAINVELDPSKFQLAAPAGLPTCGSSAPPPAASAKPPTSSGAAH